MILIYSLKVEGTCSFQTSNLVSHSTICYQNLGGQNMNLHCHKNLKSCLHCRRTKRWWIIM
jgi:hypothetical protein